MTVKRDVLVIASLVVVAILLFLGLSDRTKNKEQLHSNFDTSIMENQIYLDSIIVTYWNCQEANEYQFIFSNNSLHITSKYFDFEKNIVDTLLNRTFQRMVYRVFVDEESVILRKKSELNIESDYHVVDACGYFQGKKIFKENVSMYPNIEFNTEFLEFFDFINKLLR